MTCSEVEATEQTAVSSPERMEADTLSLGNIDCLLAAAARIRTPPTTRS